MKTSRRDFFKASLFATPFLAGGCKSFPIFGNSYIAPRRPAASERVTLAVIGCGTMGLCNMWGFLRDPRVQVVAVCDPIKLLNRYEYNSKAPGGRDHFKRVVDKHYGNNACRSVADWRDIVNDPTIDAILVATSDVWHAIISIAAMKKGKHVYCQKPMTLGINEGKVMTRIAKETGVTFQVGSQQRSASEFRVAAELFANGYLGDCKEATIGLVYPHNDSRKNGHKRDPQRMAFPRDMFENEEMWNMWQGPAEHWENNAFIPGIHGPMVWRWNYRTGGGTITDWGAHHLDIMQWALDKDKSGPVAIENFWCNFQPDDSDVVAPEVFSTVFKFKYDVVYDNGMRIHVGDTSFSKQGIIFHGEKGDLFVTRGKLERPDYLRKWNEKRDLKDTDRKLYKTKGSHESNFIDGIYSGGGVACPCEVGHRSITISHLANICARMGLKGLKWDPVAERITDNEEANKLLDVPYNNGWSLECDV